MGPADIILIIILALILTAAVIIAVKRRKTSPCCGNCAECAKRHAGGCSDVKRGG